MRTILLIMTLLLATGAQAQGVTPGDWGLRPFHFEDERLGDVDFYVTEKGLDREKPLLFMVIGCGGLPTMVVARCGEESRQIGTMPPDWITSFADDYHVVCVGKPGTAFCDTVEVEKLDTLEILENYRPSEEYLRQSGMEWQVAAGNAVIDTLCGLVPVAGDKVVALGASEGGRIVTRMAAENPRITHLACVISGGLNHFYSSIINNRIDAMAGTITHRQAQAAVDSLFDVYAQIYADPTSTQKWWYGHPYRRWASFCSDIPLEHLVRLEIPILFVSASADRNVPVLHSDYVMLEFLRLGKTNLTYRVLPGCEHWLYEKVVEDGRETYVSRKEEVLKIVADWAAVD